MSRAIAVTGKGGTGKTTVSALIIKHLKEHGDGPVLALDADPDANLATVLGLPVASTVGDIREDTLKAMKDFPAGMSKQSYIEAGLHEIIAESDQVDLISMGRSEGPGCYCYINNLLRKFAEDLTPSYKWVVLDNEAGLEHLSRRTTTNVDSLIAVINENPLSIDCARRIDVLLKEIPNAVRRKYYLINRVPDDRIEAVREKAAGLDMECLGALPHDAELERLIFAGESVYGLNGTPAASRVDMIMEQIKEK